MQRENGFTILELIVLLMVISVISVLALINIRQYGTIYQINTAEEKIVQELRIARMEAVARATNVRLSLVGTNRLQMAYLKNGSYEDLGSEKPLSDNQTVSMTFTNGFGNADNCVVFDSRGKIANITASDGTIQIGSSMNDKYTVNVYMTSQGSVNRDDKQKTKS